MNLTNINLFRQIPKSISGNDRNFSSRSDYINGLLLSTDHKTNTELFLDDEIVISTVKHWVSSGQIGCRFAQLFSGNSDKYGWKFVVKHSKFNSEEKEAAQGDGE